MIKKLMYEEFFNIAGSKDRFYIIDKIIELTKFNMIDWKTEMSLKYKIFCFYVYENTCDIFQARVVLDVFNRRLLIFNMKDYSMKEITLYDKNYFEKLFAIL